MRLGALVVCCFVTASISLRIPSIEACELREGEAVPTLIFPHKNLAATSAENHVFSIIQLALKSTENKYGPCEARLWETELPLQRMELYLEKTKKIDALALTANKTRDKRFLPVKVPVNKGMVGIRVALIRKGNNTGLIRFIV